MEHNERTQSLQHAHALQAALAEQRYDLKPLNKIVKRELNRKRVTDFEEKREAARSELNRLLGEMERVVAVLAAFHARAKTLEAAATVARSLAGFAERI